MGYPPEAYITGEGSSLSVSTDFYDRLAGSAGRNRVVTELTVPVRSGRAWTVQAGQVCRITTVEGPQVGDLNVWNLHNPRERFWASRTRQLQAAHVSTYDRLWSSLPYIRPMATIIADSLASYGEDADGGRVHDLLGSRCDPYINRLLTGEDFDYHCHSNLTRAVAPFGLTEFDVHDVLNVFQLTGLNDEDKYYQRACPAKQGDYFEFFAEQDLLCALSTCPGGDLSIPLWGPESRDLVSVCRPLGVQVFEADPRALQEWRPPVSPSYSGQHAMAGIEWASLSEETRSAQR